MTFTPPKPGGFVEAERLLHTQVNSLNTDHPFALDGRDGGEYAPSAPLVVNGAGIETSVVPTTSNDVANKAYVDTAITERSAKMEVFESNGTYTKPAWATHVRARVVPGGANGGGSQLGESSGGGGGFGSEGIERVFAASEVGATETITVGAATTVDGVPGGTSSFGSLLSVAGGYRGGSGASATTWSSGGGGGGGGGNGAVGANTAAGGGLGGNSHADIHTVSGPRAQSGAGEIDNGGIDVAGGGAGGGGGGLLGEVDVGMGGAGSSGPAGNGGGGGGGCYVATTGDSAAGGRGGGVHGGAGGPATGANRTGWRGAGWGAGGGGGGTPSGDSGGGGGGGGGWCGAPGFPPSGQGAIGMDGVVVVWTYGFPAT